MLADYLDGIVTVTHDDYENVSLTNLSGGARGLIIENVVRCVLEEVESLALSFKKLVLNLSAIYVSGTFRNLF